MTAKYYIWNGR